jgi:hypothetical protein
MSGKNSIVVLMCLLKVHRLSELNCLFILKVANIRCFILIKCSEQKARFKKSVIMS